MGMKPRSRLAPHRQRTPLVAAVLAFSAACGGAPVGLPQSAVLEVEGRAERSSPVEVRLRLDGSPVAADGVDWEVSPAGAAAWLSDSTLRLDAAGPLSIRGTADGVSVDTVLEVAAPPRIVLELNVEGNRDIYEVALDGLELARRTRSPSSDIAPTAGGAHLVFTSFRDGNAELYRLPLDGGDPVRLTQTAADETGPALSPDGSRLAYASTSSGAAKVWVSSSDGSDAARAAPGFSFDGAVETSPTWAPGADRITFMSTDAGGADLYVLDLAYGSVEALVTAAAPDVEPAWSPDGEQVAFASHRDGQTDLYLLELATGAITRLTARAEADAEPAWLPDGRIVYVAWIGGDTELRWLDPETGADPISILLPGDQPRAPAAVPERNDR